MRRQPRESLLRRRSGLIHALAEETHNETHPDPAAGIPALIPPTRPSHRPAFRVESGAVTGDRRGRPRDVHRYLLLPNPAVDRCLVLVARGGERGNPALRD